MKLLVLIILSLPCLCLGALPLGDIVNFSGNYNSPSGTAQAKSFDIAGYTFGDNPQFNVEIQANTIFLETPNESIEVQGVPNAVLDLKNLNWKNLNYTGKEDYFDVSLDSVAGRSPANSLVLEDVRLKCQQNVMFSKTMNEVLDLCFNNSVIFNMGLLNLNESGKSTIIKNFQINSINSQMNYRVTTGSITVKGRGETYFEDGLIKIKINTAKFGILNVKRRLFNELKQLEGASISVNNPWIEIRTNP